MWYMMSPIMAIIPFQLKMAFLFLAGFEIIAHSAYLSYERNIKKVVKPPTTSIVLPQKVNSMIAKCVSYLGSNIMHFALIAFFMGFEMLIPMLYTEWTKSSSKVVHEEIFTNFCFQDRALMSEDYVEAMKYRRYLIEWRNEAGFWTTGFVLLINFEKITSILKSFNRAIPQKPCKLQIAANFFTHPMLTIVYISLLLYLESCTNVLFNLWILHTTFIFSKDIIECFTQGPLELKFLLSTQIFIILVIIISCTVFWRSLFPLVTLFTSLSFREY